MEAKEQTRAPRISGTNVLGEWIDVDYSANLLTVILFFDPISKNSEDAVESIRRLAQRYQNLAIGFWFVMEPRLSCMFRGEVVQRTLERKGLVRDAIFDGNGMVELQSQFEEVPALFVADANSFVRTRYEGEISFREVERTIQARLSVSGYRDELPAIAELDLEPPQSRGFLLRQMGYVAGDYLFSSSVIPETDQQFSHPDFYLPNTIYPCGSWFVGRDFVEGKPGSTVYISCLKDESVRVFLGSEEGSTVRVHTSIESEHPLILGRDVKREQGVLELAVDEFRPYEILGLTGDTDLLISLQVSSGSLKLYCVEYSHWNQFAESHALS
jgi:hypothetical protein